MNLTEDHTRVALFGPVPNNPESPEVIQETTKLGICKEYLRSRDGRELIHQGFHSLESVKKKVSAEGVYEAILGHIPFADDLEPEDVIDIIHGVLHSHPRNYRNKPLGPVLTWS